MSDVTELWKVHKKAHHLKISSKEEAEAIKAFTSACEFVKAHNAKAGKHHTVRLNHLSHWLIEKLKAWLSFKKADEQSGHLDPEKYKIETYVFDPNYDAPPHCDWREQHAVQTVKDQAHCGSCWAFATVACVESAEFLKDGKLFSLSEQQLVDCSTVNHGCHGGWPELAIGYCIDNGLTTEEQYPYTATDGKCKKAKPVVKPTGVRRIEPKEETLMQAVARFGPCTVAIDANHPEFFQYAEGVYYNEQASSENLDHAVCVVGYGSLNGQDYWIVRNSWSEKWGMKGYALMARNKNNNSGIATEAVQAIA